MSLGRAVRAAASQTGAFSVAIDKSASTAGLVSGIVGDLALNDATSVKALGLQGHDRRPAGHDRSAAQPGQR